MVCKGEYLYYINNNIKWSFLNPIEDYIKLRELVFEVFWVVRAAKVRYPIGANCELVKSEHVRNTNNIELIRRNS